MSFYDKKVIIAGNVIEVYEYEKSVHFGYKDTRKNSRAMLSIKGLGDISLAAKPLGKKEGCTSGIVVAMSGDSEINAFIKSLKFAVKVLEDQVKEVQD